MKKQRKPKTKPEDWPRLKAEVCARLAEGEALVSMCKEAGMPSIAKVFVWLREDLDFREAYKSAREVQAERFAEEICRIADTCVDPNKARVQIDARKWLAARLYPKVYSDRVDVTSAGEKLDGGVLITRRVLGAQDEATPA